MSEASFASLGPTLLARKGGAKPAMRPQLAPIPGVTSVDADQLEDLGWNDMGGDQEDASHAPNVAMHPTARAENQNQPDEAWADAPLVHRQQKHLAERILTQATNRTGKPRSAPMRSKKSARRAAFTLRLDTDRHLKLRLAATMQGVSAQALVTEALDAMLDEIEDLDAIVERFNDRKNRN